MFGLLLRALEYYVKANFGVAVWAHMMGQARLGPIGLRSLLSYEAEDFVTYLEVAADVLGRPKDDLLVDIGRFVVSGESDSVPRRLLRFGGATFEEFLLSLEEIPERAQMALPELILPRLRLQSYDCRTFRLQCQLIIPELAPLILGMLLAMADDYGVVISASIIEGRDDEMVLAINVIEAAKTPPKHFNLVVAE